MDTPTSAAPVQKKPPLDLALATQQQQREVESLRLAGVQHRPIQLFRRPLDLKFDRRTSQVSFRTPKMQEFLKFEVDNVQRQIDNALGGINIIVETIGPWKSIARLTSGTRNVRTGGLAANIEQRIRAVATAPRAAVKAE